MIFIWILILSLPYVRTARAGITHCFAQTVGSSSTGGSSSDSATEAFMMQDPSYQFQCCGVVKTITYSGAVTSMDFFTWRQKNATEFTLISKQTYTSMTSPFTTPANMRASFREGDLFGWKPASGTINYIASSSINLNWVSSATMPTTAGSDTHPWYSKSIKSGREYLIQIGTDASTAPFFRNLPVTLKRTVNDLQSGGVILMTLSYDDIDPDDKNGLTLTMSPEWGDLFQLIKNDSTSAHIKTVDGLAAGTYSPVFRVEEDHCGKSTEKTLTLIVTDETPKITNLPAFATVHEDDTDETLLYNVTLSDPADEGIWCKGLWTVGSQASSKIPFIVKMHSTTGGSSEAGIYLIEYPQLDYDSMPSYNLTVECKDTFGTAITGKFWVNVIENQPPIFRNLGNMVEVDARTAGIGYTVFTISATDAESDQIIYTCSNCGTKFAVFDSGEVQVAEFLLDETDTTLSLSITASDLRATSNPSILIVYIRYTNTNPVLTNVAGTTKTVTENTALGTFLYQMSATDVDTTDTTLTYFMTVTPEEGNDLFEMSSSGELKTHSKYSINYELLTAYTFTLTIYVNDGKSQINDTLSVTVSNANEAPYFIATEFIVIQSEQNSAFSSFTDDPNIITAEDPDNINVTSTDSLTYSMDCGAYDAYLDISSSTGTLSFPVGYDLDNTTLDLPTYFQCTVYVNDTGGLSDNATLHVNVEYANDKLPSFSFPTYTATVNSDTPMGYSILQVSATDLDVGNGSTLTYTISSQTTANLFIIKRNELNTQIATIYANTAFGGTITSTQTLTIVVSDGLNTDTATVTVSVNDVTVVVSATTDRSWEFIEDPRNATWLSMSAITMATCIFIIFCTVIRCCMQRKRPLINFNLKSLWPKGQPKRKIDAKGRPMPFGRQVAPQYRHVHANEVLRQSPDHLASPTPVDVDSLRPGSGTSGRATVTDVHVKDEEPSWMDGTSSPVTIAAPVKSVAHARTDDWEYLNPNRRADTLSPEQMYGADTLTPGPSSALSNKRRHGSRQPSPAKRVPVSPSPVQFDNTGDDDDFRSERISIASPSSQLADESEQTY